MQLRTRLDAGGTPRPERWGDPDVSMIGNGRGAVHCMCQALKRDRVGI
jgi:hypothetical protein